MRRNLIAQKIGKAVIWVFTIVFTLACYIFATEFVIRELSKTLRLDVENAFILVLALQFFIGYIYNKMITTKKLKKDLEKLEKISDVKGKYRKEKENLLYYKKILFTARDTNDYSSAVLDCFNSLVHDSGNYLDFLIWVSENISQLENEGFNIEYFKVFDINSAANSNS